MRKKIRRFADNTACHNIIEPGKLLYSAMKGGWHEHYFNNNAPLILEVGCGTGAYTLGLAEQLPHQNFVGIDIKGARLWAGSQAAIQQKLQNVAFLRAKIEQIDQFFAPQEVSEVYIPFPDPRPRDRDSKRRLTSPRFLAIYQKLLRTGGRVHLKTDDLALFEYTIEVLQTQPIKDLVYTTDFYQSEWVAAHHGIQTTYEQRFLALGMPIKYLSFSFS